MKTLYEEADVLLLKYVALLNTFRHKLIFATNRRVLSITIDYRLCNRLCNSCISMLFNLKVKYSLDQKKSSNVGCMHGHINR